jgi:hypothetical protein
MGRTGGTAGLACLGYLFIASRASGDTLGALATVTIMMARFGSRADLPGVFSGTGWFQHASTCTALPTFLLKACFDVSRLANVYNKGNARSLRQPRSFNCNSVIALSIVTSRKLLASSDSRVLVTYLSPIYSH